MYLIGEFREKHAAAAAIRKLRDGGIGPADLDLFSEEPISLPRGLLDRPSHMSLVSVSGAIALGSLATLFVRYAQNNYKLVTGGMPLVSNWSTGVISFELVMAGAVAGVVLAFLWEGRLLRRNGAPPPASKDGSVFLRIECPKESVPRAVRCFDAAGAQDIVEEMETE